jgi:O-antigen/teichoic acid export membrane protein
VKPASVSINAAFNLGGFICTLVIAFLLSPFLVHNLGDSRYGVWVLMAELTGYYGLLDIGIRGAVGYFVARHQADHNWTQLQQILSTAFWFLVVVAALVLAVGLPLSFQFPELFRIGETDPREIVIATAIMTLGVAANVPFSVSSAILNGLRRLDLVVGTDIVVRISASLAIYLLVSSGHGLVLMSVAHVSGLAMMWTLWYVHVRRLRCTIPIWPVRFSWATFKDISRIGSATFVINCAVLVINQLQPLIIAVILGTASVTYFSMGRQVPMYCHSIVASLTMSMTTAFTFHHSRNDRHKLIELFMNSSRITGSLSLFLISSAAIFGPFFLALWVGDKFVTGDWRYRSDMVLLALLIGSIPRTFQAISSQILLGTRKLRVLTILRVGEALASIVLSLVLIRPLGITGAALGSAIPMFVSHLLLFPHTMRTFEIPLAEYWKQAVTPSLLGGAVAVLAGAVATALFPPVAWHIFLIECVLVTLAAGTVFLTVGVPLEMRRSIVGQIRNLLHR